MLSLKNVLLYEFSCILYTYKKILLFNDTMTTAASHKIFMHKSHIIA